jgi:hypothetical protein
MQGIEERNRPDEATGLVCCFWCEQLHEGEHALSVCPTCRTRLATLGSLGMSGSYPLNDEAIDAALNQKSPGNYALGYLDDDAFVVFYVGRSASDVRRRLHEWVGMPSRFERYAPQAKASWDVRRRGSSRITTPALGTVTNADTGYTRFAFSYAASAEAAFERECRNYDDFGGSRALDNEAPPTPAQL